MLPKIIKGGIACDDRGSISFVNDFKFENIKRFYVVENAEDNDTRAWHGHKKDIKHFYCVKGSFLISYVKIDKWENPSKDLVVEHTTLDEKESQILVIPAGYANSIKAIIPGSKLISFSILDMDETADDSVRYPTDMW